MATIPSIGTPKSLPRRKNAPRRAYAKPQREVHPNPDQSQITNLADTGTGLGMTESCDEVLQASEVDTFEVDMNQPFATPAMLVAAVRWISNDVKKRVEALTALYKQGGQDSDLLYNRDELAECLGSSLTTLDTMRQDPAFPCIRLTDAKSRGSVRFRLTEVMAYLNRKNDLLAEMAR